MPAARSCAESFFSAASNQSQPAQQHQLLNQSQFTMRAFKHAGSWSRTVPMLQFFHRQPASSCSTASSYRSHTASASGYAFSDAQFSSASQGIIQTLSRLFTEPVDIQTFLYSQLLVAYACIMYRCTCFTMLVRMWVRSVRSGGARSVPHGKEGLDMPIG